MTQATLNRYVLKVRTLTQDNHHNAAVTTIAQYVRAKHKQMSGVHMLVIYCQALESLAKFYGHMPQHLQQTREDLRNRCYSFLSERERLAFHNVT